jgi:flagellar basal body-associated protein FliL
MGTGRMIWIIIIMVPVLFSLGFGCGVAWAAVVAHG